MAGKKKPSPGSSPGRRGSGGELTLKPWHRTTLTIILGLAAGASVAVYRVRGGLAAGQVINGPWATAKTYGSTDADALTRARVALSGLLALPAKEAMYFTAKTDSAGRPLDGKCSYKVAFQEIPAARWWSITLYEGEGWLVRNAANRWSVGSAAFAPTKEDLDADIVIRALPSIAVSPNRPDIGNWIPTGAVSRFDLTLRTYHPSIELLAHPERAKLPKIERVSC